MSRNFGKRTPPLACLAQLACLAPRFDHRGPWLLDPFGERVKPHNISVQKVPFRGLNDLMVGEMSGNWVHYKGFSFFFSSVN